MFLYSIGPRARFKTVSNENVVMVWRDMYLPIELEVDRQKDGHGDVRGDQFQVTLIANDKQKATHRVRPTALTSHLSQSCCFCKCAIPVLFFV